MLVALVGLSATKRVGAAGIVDERWPALQLASAVSDLLGPEQLLELRAPNEIDPFSARCVHARRSLPVC